ncbi:MAG TPA: hypothetical protein VGF14_03115 [Alphaproteobacteria bacterium]
MKTNKHALSYDIRQVLQREPFTRNVEGKMHFATADNNQVARQNFETAMQSRNDLILTTGCGLPPSLEDLPLRLPSLIVPGLELLKAYQQTFNPGRNIQYHVYQAGEFIKRINGGNEKAMSHSAQFMQGYLQAFTEEFYPDLAPIVSFDFNKDVKTEKLEPIREFLHQTNNPQALEYKERINFYATRGQSRGCAEIYAAANIYFNCMSDQKIEEPVIIMPVGGQKERPFFFLSSLYNAEKRKDKDISVLPISFNHQEIPPYFPASRGDLTIGMIFKDSARDFEPESFAARKDHESLLEPIGATIPALISIAHQVRNTL